MSATAAFRVAPGSPHIPTVIHVDDACMYSDQRRYLNIILAFLSSELTPNENENEADALHAPPTLYDQPLEDPCRDSPPDLSSASGIEFATAMDTAHNPKTCKFPVPIPLK